jgi:predicted SAM-dependent methyltransferase
MMRAVLSDYDTGPLAGRTEMPLMTKLNFGCGTRIAAGWTNVDFHSSDRRVQRVNLLAGLPFPANYFDAVYSSHVLEHFTLEQAISLLREALRVLKPGGVIRIVVPDLEATVQEYQRVLDLPETDLDKPKLYQWIKIELLDQLVRSSPGGAMRQFIRRVVAEDDTHMLTYIRSRTESAGWYSTQETSCQSFFQKLLLVSREKLSTRLVYCYLASIKQLIPRHLRDMVISGSTVGERHRWMYDRYGLMLLMREEGFADISFPLFDESIIPGFAEDLLDSNIDGSPYKNISIYCEAKKVLK